MMMGRGLISIFIVRVAFLDILHILRSPSPQHRLLVKGGYNMVMKPVGIRFLPWLLEAEIRG